MRGRERPNLETFDQLILSPQNSDPSLPIDSLLEVPDFGQILDSMLPSKTVKPKHYMPTKRVTKKIRLQFPGGVEIPVDIKVNHGPEERSPEFQDRDLLHKLDNLILNKQRRFEKHILGLYDELLDDLMKNLKK